MSSCLVEVNMTLNWLKSHYCFVANLQESNTEKIFYGLDDINGASDIIIVIFYDEPLNIFMSHNHSAVLGWLNWLSQGGCHLNFYCRLRVKWTSFQWKKLVSEIVWVSLMAPLHQSLKMNCHRKKRSLSIYNSLFFLFFPILSCGLINLFLLY